MREIALRKIATTLLLTAAMLVVLAGTALAHNAGPCNDSDGDGSASGRDYAQHHIVAAAHDGALGEGGHKPGSHQGFSVCNPSGR